MLVSTLSKACIPAGFRTQGGSATLVSQYASALQTMLTRPPMRTAPSAFRFHPSVPMPPSCSHALPSSEFDAYSVDFDVGSQPHLTPRYSQGIAALAAAQQSALSHQSQSAFHSALCAHSVSPRLTLCHMRASHTETSAISPAARAVLVSSQSRSAAQPVASAQTQSYMSNSTKPGHVCYGSKAQPRAEGCRKAAAAQCARVDTSHAKVAGDALDGLRHASTAYLAGSTSRVLERMTLVLR